MARHPTPTLQLLSNGRYHVMVTATGGGYSRWNHVALTRWQEDAGGHGGGCQYFLRDQESGQVWSTTAQPLQHVSAGEDTAYSPGLATIRGRCADIDTQTDIVVAPDDDVELRRLCITNRSSVRRTLSITSYAEIVLGAQAADSAHPAFEKLFVETEILGPEQALLCTRRARSQDEATPFMFQLLASNSAIDLSYETDRMHFIGRGRSPGDPRALDDDAALSGSVGAVLDPVAAIRCSVSADPGQCVVIDYFTGIAGTLDSCTALAQKCRAPGYADTLVASANRHGRALLTQLHASEADARLFTRLAAPILFATADWRAGAEVLARNQQGQPGLWALSISGDLPIVLLQVDEPGQLDFVRQLMRAQAYWRRHGLAADLVILVGGGADTGSAALLAQITTMLAASDGAGLVEKAGGIFVRAAHAIPEEGRVLLQSFARLVIDAGHGPLQAQVERRRSVADVQRPPVPIVRRLAPAPLPAVVQTDLLFANGLGGFTPDGREYVITVSPGHMTPVPWVNVLANPAFGTLVSESGSASTWSENAQAFRLTPWANDPVADPNTEAVYLRDEDSGHFWSPTLLPSAGTGSYKTRHGFGYSVFEHDEDGVASGLTMFVAMAAPIKFLVLTLCNRSGRDRRLSVTGYVEWVLGDERAKTAMHVGTARSAGSGALFAHNPGNADFAGRTAFFDVDAADAPDVSVCCDRQAFLGPGGTLRRPGAMSQARLSGTAGFALDPCAALRVPFTLADGETREIVFRLGAGATPEEACALVQRWRGPDAAHEALSAVKRHWTRTLGAVQVCTPDPSFDLLANGWLAYQTLACRLWARNAFYQSSGAFGFRDQLQDVMALVHAAPALVRQHLLRCAARQFAEGDVQHWWHPPAGRGVRTRCSDDFLWLPLATCRYVAVTGDTGVLDESAPFLSGSALRPGQMSCYELPTASGDVATLYEHGVHAIEHGLRFGVHGLPLMGGGDWNDGMNLVGAGGQGESVWLGFFLVTVLTQFGALAQQRGDTAFAGRCNSEATRLRAAIEQSAWDGAWYRRGWFDDGSPLGTSANTECQIDSIAQSWSVLGGAQPEHTRQAMAALDAHLVHRDSALVQLLDPPFDHSDPSPGYIQGYVRGVRENGGQYTHAAVWAAMAFAALGDARRAWELFTILDPIRHADSAQAIDRYKVEPYVIASDVYALPPHTGRGGWTWYTGSAGWMLRFMVESLLGLQVEGDQLRMTPCCPADWPSFALNYRYRETLYRIEVHQTQAALAGSGWTLDGTACPGPAVTLVDDRREHSVLVRLHPRGA
ncbi:MAG: GH36-type glycosyl hydrolase domain-containing protein [Burkholderiaceae bacterium]